MSKHGLDLVDVIKVARDFAEIAGWGYFRVKDVKWENEHWVLKAFLSAWDDKIMTFHITDDTSKVIYYTTEETKNDE